MSNKTPKIDPPTIEETADDLGKLNLESGSEWNQASQLKVGQHGADKRGSGQLSILSEESRRQSLFAEEDPLFDKSESEASSDHEDDDNKKKRQDEVFIDKARAAMVVIGTKDIKDALERKKTMEIFRKTPEAKVASVLFQQAKYLMKQSRYKEALVLLNRALNVDPDHKEWLTEKSRCYLKLLHPEFALQFVDQVLKKDPRYFRALVLKGEVLYSLWDLEKSMLCFVEGRRMRPDNTECIRGVHKVKMALEEIAAFRVPRNARKQKEAKKRSKSAKGRLTSVSPSEGFITPNPEPSVSSRRPSSRLSPVSEDNSSPSISRIETPSAVRPFTAVARQRIESSSVSRSQMSDLKTPRESQLSPRKATLTRPKTAANRRSRSKSGDLEIEDIRKFVKESMSGSYKSSTLRRLSGSTQMSGHGSFSSQTFSSSMEDVSGLTEIKLPEAPKLPEAKKTKASRGHQQDKTTPETKISVSLHQDKVFLNSFLRNRVTEMHTALRCCTLGVPNLDRSPAKTIHFQRISRTVAVSDAYGLRRSKTAYTKRALRIAREVQTFVSEREKYWKAREQCIRFAKTDEDTLI